MIYSQTKCTIIEPVKKNYLREIAIIFLSISLNMCFRCSKEPSHWDCSFEYPQHVFWLRNKKNNFQLHTFIWGPDLTVVFLTINSADEWKKCGPWSVGCFKNQLTIINTAYKWAWFTLDVCPCSQHYWGHLGTVTFLWHHNVLHHFQKQQNYFMIRVVSLKIQCSPFIVQSLYYHINGACYKWSVL